VRDDRRFGNARRNLAGRHAALTLAATSSSRVLIRG
jgi:hypothetical protein